MADLNITPGILNVTGQADRAWRLRLNVTAGGTAVNLTGYHCTWGLVPAQGGTAVLTAAEGTGITMGGTAGYVDFDVIGSVAAGPYSHEFRLVEPGGDPVSFVSGAWVVTEVTI